MTKLISTLKAATTTLLNYQNDYKLMKESVDTLYQIFSTTTGVTIDKFNIDKDIMLPAGKAISPSGAAHCLLEMKRTVIFLRGIKKAIDTKVVDCDNFVRILYAGCGPYGTLITPLLQNYSTDRVRVTFLDINNVSLKASEKLINKLGLGDYIEQYILADATTYKIDSPFDIVISETMQAGLKKEPQVAIMQNLIPQCKENTIFIPERITIEAYLQKRGIWDGDELIEKGGETYCLCELFSVNKINLDSRNYRKALTLPQTFDKPYDLLLYTTVNIFDNEVLGLNDCSLNMPLRYFEFRGGYPNSIEFWYNQSSDPKIESKIIDYIA